VAFYARLHGPHNQTLTNAPIVPYYGSVSDSTTPVSGGPRTSAVARAAVFLFFSIFLAAGAAFGIGAFGRPLLHMFAARHWQSASCEIISSRVQTNQGSDGSMYRVDVTYRYFVDDRGLVGNRYQFMDWSTSGSRGKAAIVGRLRPGTRTECWLNPANPGDAVIERGLTADLWFGLIPLVFISIGGAGMYFAAFGRGRSSDPMSARSTTRSATFTKAIHGAEPATLRPRMRRGVLLAVLIIFALFWNGMLSLFLKNLLPFSGRGTFHWLLGLFLVPFILAGIGLVALAIHQALQLANPRPKVTVSTSIVRLGDELRVDWSLEGRVKKLTRFNIRLEASEQATYARGTDRTTDTNVFATITLANQIAPNIAVAGSAKARIPADTMHSFDATHNKVVWVIRVRGEVPNWPDSDDEFPLTVAPRDR
jgi:hypothetical protein